MDVPPAEVIEEVAAQLKQKLVHGNGSGKGAVASGHYSESDSVSPYGKPRSAGQAALQAILAEMNQANGQPSIGNPSIESGYANSVTTYGSGATYASGEYASLSKPSGNLSEQTAIGRASSSAGTPDGHSLRHSQAAVDSTPTDHHADAAHLMVEKISRPAKSTAEIHSQLISTPPTQLREALASVDGRQAILALCGLPKATAEAVLNDLPRRQAKQIRQQIASFAMVELREIDTAKEAVANAIRPRENRASDRAATIPKAPSSATLAAA
jgi:hypothetical protein